MAIARKQQPQPQSSTHEFKRHSSKNLRLYIISFNEIIWSVYFSFLFFIDGIWSILFNCFKSFKLLPFKKLNTISSKYESTSSSLFHTLSSEDDILYFKKMGLKFLSCNNNSHLSDLIFERADQSKIKVCINPAKKNFKYSSKTLCLYDSFNLHVKNIANENVSQVIYSTRSSIGEFPSKKIFKIGKHLGGDMNILYFELIEKFTESRMHMKLAGMNYSLEWFSNRIYLLNYLLAYEIYSLTNSKQSKNITDFHVLKYAKKFLKEILDMKSSTLKFGLDVSEEIQILESVFRKICKKEKTEKIDVSCINESTDNLEKIYELIDSFTDNFSFLVDFDN